MRFYGQFQPPLDQEIYENFFPHLRNGVAIEAGAGDGVFENSTKFFEEERGWLTINVEASPLFFDDLVNNRKNSININRALHPTEDDKQVVLYVPKHSIFNLRNHLGSLSKETAKRSEMELSEITVKTITFNQLIRHANLTRIDLFVLDIEGYEGEFLSTLKSWDIKPRLLVVEISQTGEHVIDKLLLPWYQPVRVSFVNKFYLRRPWGVSMFLRLFCWFQERLKSQFKAG